MYGVGTLHGRVGLDVTVIDLREKFGIAGDRSAGNSAREVEKNM